MLGILVPTTLQWEFTYLNFKIETKFFVQITLHNFSLQFVFSKKELDFLDSFFNFYEFLNILYKKTQLKLKQSH
jgi:hypothetical protein